MAYIGVSPSNGVRQKHTYTATASQTTFSGAGSEGVSLSYRDSNYVDVYRNGVKLGDADYTATSGTSVVLGEGAAVSDIIEIVTYDVFSVADTVSKADGGTFDGNVAMAGTLAVTGETTLSTHLNMGDDDRIKLGDDADLKIFHDASNSQIINNVGHLNIDNNGDDKQINLRSDDGSGGITTYLRVNGNTGAVQLYYYGNTKLATTNTGIDVTGTVVSDGMSTNTAGTSNFIAGVNAGNSITSGGNYNVTVGDEAGTALTTGDKNTAIGFEALATEDAHGNNTAVGYRALKTLNAGSDSFNVAIGVEAGRDMTIGSTNSILGTYAGQAITEGSRNTALGYFALATNTNGNRNVAVGRSALGSLNHSSSTDGHNVAVGENAGLAMTTGTLNTIIGGLAGDALTDADRNTVLGYQALTTDTQGSRTVAIGFNALASQNFTSATNSYNTAVGYGSGEVITTGVQNTIIGGLAGDSLTDADYNVALGYSALSADTQGNRSVAIGYSALLNQNFTSSTDVNNVAIGFEAGKTITDGCLNGTFIGYQAGKSNTGNKNQFFGASAGSEVTSGGQNVILGRYNGNQGGLDIRTSSNNIVLSDGDGNPRFHIDNNANLLWGGITTRLFADATSTVNLHKNGDSVLRLNRGADDGEIVRIGQDGNPEGSISVSGTTISYNGGHLSRWSQLANNTRDNTIVKGTVMTNLDQMAEWTTDGVTEDNEQLNCMAVSSVEGDANVAGVFVNWDNDDDIYTSDMNIGMTGDMVIRIAQGTTVARGDLLMSAGDGTAKPQGDDIVRSKTIAKVTSTNVSHTYDDGTYLVPCVLMAC